MAGRSLNHSADLSYARKFAYVKNQSVALNTFGKAESHKEPPAISESPMRLGSPEDFNVIPIEKSSNVILSTFQLFGGVVREPKLTYLKP